jgi:hypothetical protein
MKTKTFNTGLSYFDHLLESPLDRFTKTKEAIEISAGYVPDDVLERIDGYELTDTKQFKLGMRKLFSTVFTTTTLKKILTNREDDTNETTKGRIELLYNKIKGFKYFIILN